MHSSFDDRLVWSAATGHVAVVSAVDPERVDSGLPEDHAGPGRHSLASFALAVDIGQSFDIFRGRRGLAD